jgi:hypothetical protein
LAKFPVFTGPGSPPESPPPQTGLFHPQARRTASPPVCPLPPPTALPPPPPSWTGFMNRVLGGKENSAPRLSNPTHFYPAWKTPNSAPRLSNPPPFYSAQKGTSAGMKIQKPLATDPP